MAEIWALSELIIGFNGNSFRWNTFRKICRHFLLDVCVYVCLLFVQCTEPNAHIYNNIVHIRPLTQYSDGKFINLRWKHVWTYCSMEITCIRLLSWKFMVLLVVCIKDKHHTFASVFRYYLKIIFRSSLLGTHTHTHTRLFDVHFDVDDDLGVYFFFLFFPCC